MNKPLTREDMHPWLRDFAAEPQRRLDQFLRGAALIQPFGLANPVDTAPQLFGPARRVAPDLFDLFDRTLLDWLVAQRAIPAEVTPPFGMKIYASEVCDSLTVANMLAPPRTVKCLVDEMWLWKPWAARIRHGLARDALARYLLILADHPISRRFEKDWLRLARETGIGRWPDAYIDIALKGLRHLPVPAGADGEYRTIAAIATGLSLWADGLGEDGQEPFRHRWHNLRYSFPLPGPQAWADLLEPIWIRRAGKPFVGWWQADLGVGALGARTGGRRQVEPQAREIDTALTAHKSRRNVSEAVSKFTQLLNIRLQWAEQTGDSTHLVISAGRLSTALLRDAPSFAAHWMPICIQWAPFDQVKWNLWSRALRAHGRAGAAECVFWEALRRFPDNEPTHTELARLLLSLSPDRWAEGEALLRQAAKRFPGNEQAHVELARCLVRKGPSHWREAEGLLVKVTGLHRDNEQAHVELARLRAALNGPAAGVRVLEGLKAQISVSDTALTSLAHLHLNNGDLPPAQALLAELQQRRDVYGVQQLTKAIARFQEHAARGEPMPLPVLPPDFGGTAEGDTADAAELPGDIRLSAPVTWADFVLDSRHNLPQERQNAARLELQRLLNLLPNDGYTAIIASFHLRTEIPPARLAALPGAVELRLAVALRHQDAGAIGTLMAERPDLAPWCLMALALLEEGEGLIGLGQWLTAAAPAHPLAAATHAALRAALTGAKVALHKDAIADALVENAALRKSVTDIWERDLRRINLPEFENTYEDAKAVRRA